MTDHPEQLENIDWFKRFADAALKPNPNLKKKRKLTEMERAQRDAESKAELKRQLNECKLNL